MPNTSFYKRKEIKNVSGIYKIENKINGNSYVGSAVDIYSRWVLHTWQLRKEKHANIVLQRAWNKHGESNFVFSVIEKCNKETLISREQFYIDKLHPEYNISKKAGSQLGFRFSDASKEKMRISHLGKKVVMTENRWIAIRAISQPKRIEAVVAAIRGIKRSLETKAKMSAAQKKRYEKPEQREKAKAVWVIRKAKKEGA